MASLIGYPCFVKPANLGSSVGISKSSRRKSCGTPWRRPATEDPGGEGGGGLPGSGVSVLGNDERDLYSEIVPGGEFDYRAKYLDDSSG